MAGRISRTHFEFREYHNETRTSSLDCSLGRGISTFLSRRPGLRRAGSRVSGRLVAMITCNISINSNLQCFSASVSLPSGFLLGHGHECFHSPKRNVSTSLESQSFRNQHSAVLEVLFDHHYADHTDVLRVCSFKLIRKY